MVSLAILELISIGSVKLGTLGHSACKGNIFQLLPLHNGNMIMKTWPLSIVFYKGSSSSQIYYTSICDKMATQLV